ncbi:glucagon-like peptide 1 receptor [Huso huso]|uniref:Glucagon-like peptide 1 receptor n=1 Tax=Huso huso TaxID=61971 RepID=A0ABR0Z0F4_HUSHU
MLGLLLLCLPMELLQVSGESVVEQTVARWKEYELECWAKMMSDPHPDTDVFCNRTFDNYACWPDSLVGSVMRVPCPPYLPWYERVQSGHVYRRCMENGSWLLLENSSLPWRDFTECLEDSSVQHEMESQKEFLGNVKAMYTAGYSLSIASLSFSAGIFVSFRSLHCMRNSIHLNLFVALMLRAVSVLVKDGLLHQRYNPPYNSAMDWEAFTSDQTAAGCRVAQVLMQYCIGASYYWLLVEGLYLQAILSLSSWAENKYFRYHIMLGWGAPLLSLAPWVLVKYLHENEECWSQNISMRIWWIIRAPAMAAVLINSVIFIHAIVLLLLQFNANKLTYTDTKYRLAKSTLTLIPLLGVHEILFVFVMDETAVGLLSNVKLTFELLLTSFQGFIVAVLYCFANHEVQSELKKLCGGLCRKPGTSHSGSVVSFLSDSRYDTEPLNGDLQATGRDGQACIKQTAIYP